MGQTSGVLVPIAETVHCCLFDPDPILPEYRKLSNKGEAAGQTFCDGGFLQPMKKTLLILAAAAFAGSAFGAACVTTPPNNNILTGANGTINQAGVADTYVPCQVGPATFSNVSYLLDAGSFTTAFPDVAMVTTMTNTGLAEIELNPNLAA